jgi:RNA polymerase sigma factor (sigma-70 family)
MMNEVIKNHYEENYDLLVKRMARRLDSVEDGEDVVQEAFTRAIQYYKSWAGNRFENWFNVILSNTYKRFISEKKMGGLSKPLEDSLEEIEPIIVNYLDSIASSELEALINKKGGRDRDILMLNIFYGYSWAEIAAILCISKKAIDGVVYRFNLELKGLSKDEKGGAV